MFDDDPQISKLIFCNMRDILSYERWRVWWYNYAESNFATASFCLGVRVARFQQNIWGLHASFYIL